MRYKDKRCFRSEQVLRLLVKHGPLSARGLEVIVSPKISRKCLLELLGRLQKIGLVGKRNGAAFDKGCAIFHLVDNESIRRRVMEVLGLSPDHLIRHFNGGEILHNESCAFWAENFARLVPDAMILRDHEFASHSIAKERLILGEKNGRDAYPDILLIVNAITHQRPIVLAIEIERTLKSSKRLEWKLKKISTETTVDGLIYICDKYEISQKLAVIFKSKTVQDANRIAAFHNHFLLFSMGELEEDGSPKLQNSAQELVRFFFWLKRLQEIDDRSRRDHMFSISGSAAG